MAVSKINTVLNEDGEEVYNLSGYSNGKQVFVKCPLDAEQLPETGDIIQYAVNAKNEVKLMKVISGHDTEDYEYNTFLDDISYSKCSNIISVNNGIITADKSGKYINYYTDNNTVVYNIKNSERENISIGNVDDITDEDKIFILLREGIANEIFVWKAE